MERLTIITKAHANTVAWTFDISNEDWMYILDKYGNEGCSVSGTMEEIIEELRGVIT